MGGRDWSDLPSELLELIALRLGLIELLSFRGVCKDWNSATSTASAEIEALPNREPWFLLYGEDNSQCMLVTDSNRKYTITIPELNGATCLASNQGWLLLFREGSIFFFCPFSRAKIELPGDFPDTVISDDIVAVFSSPPTSQDCFVCVVMNGIETEKFELYAIHRGAAAWTKHQLDHPLDKIEYVAYHDGVFYLFDDTHWMVYFSIEDRRLGRCMIRYAESEKEKCLPLTFCSDTEKNEMKKRLGLEEGIALSTCGTVVSCDKADKMIPYEDTEDATEPGCNPLKGVWFQPRFHQIDQKQSW